MRLDRLLYFLRLAKSRSGAQRWIGEERMRLNGARVTRQDQPVARGDVLTLPFAREVRVIEILALPTRRGPAAEAQACYRPLDAGLDASPAKRIAQADAPQDKEPAQP